jgi:hypothetical protein
MPNLSITSGAGTDQVKTYILDSNDEITVTGTKDAGAVVKVKLTPPGNEKDADRDPSDPQKWTVKFRSNVGRRTIHARTTTPNMKDESQEADVVRPSGAHQQTQQKAK